MAEQAIALVAPFDSNGDILLLKRGDRQHCAGLWSFPGGKIESGEQALQAAMRELSEETGLCGSHWQQLGEQRFSYPDRTLHFTLFSCLCKHTDSLQAESPHIWTAPDQLETYPMPEANRSLIPMLKRREALFTLE